MQDLLAHVKDTRDKGGTMRGGKGSATTEERTAFCAASQTQVVHLHLTE